MNQEPRLADKFMAVKQVQGEARMSDCRSGLGPVIAAKEAQRNKTSLT